MIALFFACAAPGDPEPDGEDKDSADTAAEDTADTDPVDTDPVDTGQEETGDTGVSTVVYDPWPFVDVVISYVPGDYAGYGQDEFPDVVYGPPESPGDGGGSLDVLSLGQEGEIVVEFRALELVDGAGVDILVFENPFTGWAETAVVGVSDDGVTWTEWPCDPLDVAGGYPGCAGVALVYASSTNGVDATDPEAAGGDAFDLADIGVSRARYVRIRDSGANSYAGTSGGFDLDAVAVVNGEPG